MSKFKAGDKVRVVKNVTGIGEKDKYIGKTYTLHGFQGANLMWGMAYGIDEMYVVYDSELAPANTQKIVITSDGEITLARLYDGKKVIRTAQTKCASDDEFDFETGAKIAFDRLVNPEPVAEEPRYYTGKVVCAKADWPGDYMTEHKIYSFTDGFFYDDLRRRRPMQDNPIKSLDDDVRNVFGDHIEFFAIKGDKTC